MASTSKLDQSEEDDEEAEEEEVEHFDDFTLASSWERFISEIEAVSRQWLADGPKNLLEKGAVHLASSENMYKVKHELKHASKSYCMEYYFETKKKGNVEPWDFMLHDLQLTFGVSDFLVIQPQSASGVVLDAPEATKLLSAVAIASSNSSSCKVGWSPLTEDHDTASLMRDRSAFHFWPAFVPVHDPSREAYIGIQNMGTVFTRRFEADRLGSQVPVKFMHLEGLYELFVSKFAFSILDLSVHLLRVHFRMKLTYQMIPHDDDDDDDMLEDDAENTGSVANTNSETQKKTQWDDDCPWSEWYSAEEPVKAFDLITTWSEKVVESSSDMAELENASPHEAEKWYLIPNIALNLDSSEGNRVGFASQLKCLVNALEVSFQAKFMEDFVSVENIVRDNLKSSMIVPPPTVLDRVLKELFHEGGKFPDFGKDKNKYSRAIKGASHESLFAQFCLHALWFGSCNIRAIAVLWIEFVREVRWCWEELQPLPKMPVDASIDLSTCLINQKLQMLAICIEKKRELSEEFLDCLGSNDEGFAAMEEDDLAGEDSNNLNALGQKFDGKRDSSIQPDSSNESKITLSKITARPAIMSTGVEKSSHSIRRGSAGPVGSMKLLRLSQALHAPFTQDAPIMTEDMHEERLQAVEAFGDSFNFSAQLERDVLFSDMSAFKAANPDAVFEDFIRWHSPGDWVNDDNVGSGKSGNVAANDVENDWPPRGQLSQRMSEHGNLWQQIWNDAPELPTSEQKPLLDPNREGEKVLHYLETLRPHQLLEQMVCTAFRASADTLNQTSFGGLKQMNLKMDQLYITMASSLRPLQTNQLSSNSEVIEDLRRLCVVFDHVEKLLTLAASLHREFLQAPRVSEAIFSEYQKFYTPLMGMGSVEVNSHKEFDMKLLLRMNEREVVSSMFAPPSANQSWRKVLSMGNLLNGHEPVLREIIFSTRETVSDFRHAAATSTSTSTSKACQEELETYRMYIHATANDIRVALSVISSD